MSMFAREMVRTTTKASRRESTDPPGGIRLAKASNNVFVDSKDFGLSLRRYLPVARIKLSAMNG